MQQTCWGRGQSQGWRDKKTQSQGGDRGAVESGQGIRAIRAVGTVERQLGGRQTQSPMDMGRDRGIDGQAGSSVKPGEEPWRGRGQREGPTDPERAAGPGGGPPR